MLFSVAIPAYNVQAYVHEALDSVAGQSFADFEIVVVDDGSVDATAMKVLEWSNANPSVKLELIRQSNKGIGGARNSCIRAAQGDYIAFLDADDLWAGEKLAVI